MGTIELSCESSLCELWKNKTPTLSLNLKYSKQFKWIPQACVSRLKKLSCTIDSSE